VKFEIGGAEEALEEVITLSLVKDEDLKGRIMLLGRDRLGTLRYLGEFKDGSLKVYTGCDSLKGLKTELGKMVVS